MSTIGSEIVHLQGQSEPICRGRRVSTVDMPGLIPEIDDIRHIVLHLFVGAGPIGPFQGRCAGEGKDRKLEVVR